MILQEILNTTLIELIAGLGYLFGHFLLSKQKISGWVVKIIGGIAWIVFLFQNKNHIFMAVAIVIVLTMMYGRYKWKVGNFDKHTKVDSFFEILAAIIAIFMISKFVFSGAYQTGKILESIIVITEILGTVLLARKKVEGWYAYIITSALTGILVIFINKNPAIVLGMLEITSIYFYYKGIKSFSRKRISS